MTFFPFEFDLKSNTIFDLSNHGSPHFDSPHTRQRFRKIAVYRIESHSVMNESFMIECLPYACE